MATLTKKEQAWLNELQEVLDRCPLLGWCSYLMGHHTSAHFPMSDAQST